MNDAMINWREKVVQGDVTKIMEENCFYLGSLLE